MAADPTLMIGAATALVTALAHAFVQVSKELREWRKDNRRRAQPSGRSVRTEPLAAGLHPNHEVAGHVGQRIVNDPDV